MNTYAKFQCSSYFGVPCRAWTDIQTRKKAPRYETPHCADAWLALTPGLRRRLACTDAWPEATPGVEQLVVYITQKQYTRMGAHPPPFQTKYPKKRLFPKNKKSIFNYPLVVSRYQISSLTQKLWPPDFLPKTFGPPLSKQSTLKNDFFQKSKKPFLTTHNQISSL